MTIQVSVEPWRPLGRVSLRPFFAVSDVHGCVEQLRALHESIGREVLSLPATNSPPLVVHLGDYIDRGPRSIEALDVVRAGIPSAECVALTGNHEQMLRQFLDGPSWRREDMLEIWKGNGGRAVLRELRIAPEKAGGWTHLSEPDLSMPVDELRDAVERALGEERLAFLRGLKTYVRLGDIILVHGGVSPFEPLNHFLNRGWSHWPDAWHNEGTSPLWIRREFLHHDGKLPEDVFVIHGHTPEKGVPVLKHHRLGLDAYSYKSGEVVAAQVVGDQFRMIRVIDDEWMPV